MDHAEPIQPIYLVAFVGHRPGDGSGRSRDALDACAAPIRDALRSMQEQAHARDARVELVCSAAAGADIIACDAARELGIPVHVVLPKPVDAFLEDFEGPSAPDAPRAREIIRAAQDDTSDWTFRVSEGEPVEPSCYHEANVEMLEAADALLALWNGEPESGIGGTGEAVRAARELGFPICIVDPSKGGSIVREGAWEDWPPPSAVFDAIRNDLSNERLRATPGTRRGDGKAWSLFMRLDAIATGAGGHFRDRLIKSLVLHFVAAILAATTTAFAPVMSNHQKELDGFEYVVVHNAPKVLTGIELVLVFWAWLLMHQAAKIHSHGVWRRTRFAAELSHGLIMSSNVVDPIRPLIVRHDMAWKRFALTMGLLAHRSEPPMGFETRRDRYLDGRVKDQAAHFRERLPGAGRWNDHLITIARYATILAPIVIAVAFAIKLSDSGLIKTSYMVAMLAALCPVLFPLAAGAATSLIVALDAGRRSQRYSAMADRLELLAKVIPNVRTIGALRRLAIQIEEIMLDELIEWNAASKNMGH
jgi:hypothetical protein